MDNNRTNTQKVIKGISSQTIVTVVLGIVGVLSFSIMSRLLSQQDFGYYASIVAISTVFSAFAESGIGSALIQKKELNSAYINDAFTLSLFFGLFASMLLFSLSGILAEYIADKSMKVPLMIFSSTLFCNCVTSINTSLMQRRLQFFRIGLIQLISLVVTTIVAVILALKGFGYYAILTKAVLSSFLTLIISYFAVNVKYRLSFNLSQYKKIFGFSGWLMASAFFRLLSSQMDRLLMTRLFSIKALGLYTRPKEFISSFTYPLFDIFDKAMFPVLSSIQDEKQKLQHSFYYALYFMNIVGLLATFFLLFNSELIIRIFLGEKWLNVNILFLVISILPIEYVNGKIGDIFLRSLALTRQQFNLRVLQAIASVIFIIIGARWGLVSLAISSILAYMLLTMTKIFYLSVKIDVPISKTIIIIAKSFKVSLFIVPILVVCFLFIPNDIAGNLIKLGVFVLSIVLIFIVFPSSVGKVYKQEAYNKIMGYIKHKIFKTFLMAIEKKYKNR